MTRHIFFAGFSLTLAAALTYYINSSFLTALVGEGRLGLVYILGAVVAGILILLTPPLGRRYGLLKPIRWFGIIFFAALITLMISRSRIVQLGAFIIIHATIINLGLWLDIYLETLSSDRHTGRIRGGYLTLINAAVLFSPLVSGNILNQVLNPDWGYRIVYLISGFAALPFLQQIFFRLTEQSLPIKLTNWRLKLRDRNLRKILFLDFLLNLFYFFMVIYLPLYLVQTVGFSWGNIGFIFTLMLLPFVLIEYPLGWLADRKFGEKELLVVGLVIIVLAMAPIAFLTTKNILVWLIILFFTRVGAATVESMKETYLFKQVTAGDIGIISLSRFTIPSAYLIGSIVSLIFLRFFPMSYLFLLISVLFVLGLYFSLTLKDTK